MHPRDLSIADFTYSLPEERIARHPLPERDAARLLAYRDGAITDHAFRELPELLPPGTLLVLNDTRVVNARIPFRRGTGARIEVFCLGPAHGRPVEQALAGQGGSEWDCSVGNARRWKEGEELAMDAGDLRLKAVRTAPGRILFTWEPAGLSFAEVLDRLGQVPLPPYLKRPDGPEDRERYNTVFARHGGAVAAPTASLHFTPKVLEGLEAGGIGTTELTLHVGAGTFLPVKGDRMAEHPMHTEQVRVPLATLEGIAARIGKAPIIPVGTTALRTLESIHWHGVKLLDGGTDGEMDIAQWEPYERRTGPLPDASRTLEAVIASLRANGGERLMGRTRLLIAPGYRFHLADALITNFHQPRSTLLLLVAALIGPDWRKAYGHALANGYRFLSYGDGSLLWRGDR